MTSIPKTHRRVVLVRRPPGEPAESDFRVEEAPVPEPRHGEVLVKVHYLSLDPYQRGRMRDAASYASPVGLDEVMTGGTVGEVVASQHSGFKVGDIVEDRLGWQEYAIGGGPALRKVDPSLAPISTANGVLGMPGMTAYFGLLHVGQPKPGETVVVSAALRRRRPGGGPDCEDHGLPHRRHRRRHKEVRLRERRTRLRCLHRLQGREGPRRRAARRLPQRARRLFRQCRRRDHRRRPAQHQLLRPGRAVRLDLAVQRDRRLDGAAPARHLRRQARDRPRLHRHRLRAVQYGPAMRQMGEWIRDGRLKYREDIVEGIDKAPRAFIGLLRGENFGKMLVKLA